MVMAQKRKTWNAMRRDDDGTANRDDIFYLLLLDTPWARVPEIYQSDRRANGCDGLAGLEESKPFP
jgi:hypothetical protein